MAEKALDATPARLARAKREGDVAVSHELTGVCAFAGALGGCAAAIPHIALAAQSALTAAARGESDAAALFAIALWTIGVLCCGCIAAAIASIVQLGGLQAVPLKIDPSRLSPVQNLRRMFSRETVVTIVRACAAFGSTAGALAILHGKAAPSLAATAWSASLRSAWTACAVGALFSAADYALQAARRKKRLRMSFEEFKRDQREQDGDPLARARRKAAHRAILRGSLHRLRDAAFVVTNPTHLAIALEYAPPDVPVPRVLIRAADDAALHVRSQARELGISVIENVPLARELFAKTNPGESIPQETYVAVAEIVASLARAGIA